MKKLLLVILVVALSGCGSINKQFAERMDSASSKLLPDLRKAYKGEPLSLTPEQLSARLILLDEWEKSIREAKAASEK